MLNCSIVTTYVTKARHQEYNSLPYHRNGLNSDPSADDPATDGYGVYSRLFAFNCRSFTEWKPPRIPLLDLSIINVVNGRLEIK